VKITEKSFWETYWGDIVLPKRVDFNFKNDRVIAETILENIPVAKKGQIALEIGCAPGKWMVLLYEKLHYNIDGFEYLDVAAEKTRKNFVQCDIPKENFNVVTADFLTAKPKPIYDLVTSFGFIEHFENYEEIYQKHLAYTKNGGYIVIGFPNFRGINYYIQLLIDKISGTEIIKNHNISMMDLDLMKSIIKNSNKKIIYANYIGGFESALFDTNKIKNKILRLFIKIIIKLLSIVFPTTTNKHICSYLIFIVKND